MTRVPIDQIKVGVSRRPVDPKKVRELSESICTNGLLNPITLDCDYNLIAGHHRLQAFQLLGWTEIDCHIIEFDSQERARLAEIDENLIRNELSILERGELWWEREQILAKLGLRAKSGDNQYTCKGGAMISPPLTTTRELAQQTGYSERTFQLGKQIAKDIHPEVKKKIQGTALAKGTTHLKKIAQIGHLERNRAEIEEQAAVTARSRGDEYTAQLHQERAKQLRETQKNLQLQALQLLIHQHKTGNKRQKTTSVCIPKSPPVATNARQTARKKNNSNVLHTGQNHHLPVKKGDEWTVGRHLVYCGDTANQQFINLLPKNAALAIAIPSSLWNHDYLANEAEVVAVIRSEGYIHEFMTHQHMPFQFELIIDHWYVGIFSHRLLKKLPIPMQINDLTGIMIYLINTYTNPKNFVIAPFLGDGEVLMICEQTQRTCFTGDVKPEVVERCISHWQLFTRKQAQKIAS